MTTQNTTCYCGNRQPYEDCCMRIHLDQKQAQTAEQLMRARYSAFAVQDINFLYESFYVATRGFQNKKEIQKWAEESKWLQLQIVRTNINTVEFEAHYLDAQLNLQIHHEISRFKQTEGIWYYVDGDLLS